MCGAGPMAQSVCPVVSAADHARLEAVVANRNHAQKHGTWVRIILGSAERLNVAAVARRAGVGRTLKPRGGNPTADHRWVRSFLRAGHQVFVADPRRHQTTDPESRVILAPSECAATRKAASYGGIIRLLLPACTATDNL